MGSDLLVGRVTGIGELDEGETGILYFTILDARLRRLHRFFFFFLLKMYVLSFSF